MKYKNLRVWSVSLASPFPMVVIYLTFTASQKWRFDLMMMLTTIEEAKPPQT
ncbi:predicted protein [Sclerotinia sclerotiorum 1980 UF-70]|uniref:Uncharacterized protein n=1 Tax=Sclerotinia sclerotiorum (strain ATCC 18683 / 1980 / Ss-1) TaxID=665079 RepID=A7ED51_SCLS1|nr:predicted protein [Sclerotinia sclerotiorum 1980 UF-70]EDO00767.1 predicted protein [Sclerotinia sclerotiorum 1980 UF-70]